MYFNPFKDCSSDKIILKKSLPDSSNQYFKLFQLKN